jgi:hypothetical protein
MSGTTTVGVLISLSILLALGAGLSLVYTPNEETDMEELLDESLRPGVRTRQETYEISLSVFV